MFLIKRVDKSLSDIININSYRYKFDEIKELLSDKIVDIFFVAESKLDRKSHTVMLSCYSLQVVYILYRGTVWVQSDRWDNYKDYNSPRQ
jgi:hypothetical protein